MYGWNKNNLTIYGSLKVCGLAVSGGKNYFKS